MKTHNYNIIKTFTIDEIKALGKIDSFEHPVAPGKKIKMKRANIINKIGYDCVVDGCNLSNFHFGLGLDNGGGIHLDLYGYDEDEELVSVTIDHIRPKSKGGSDELSNLQPMCKIHNHTKSDVFYKDRSFIDINSIYPDEELSTQNYIISKQKFTSQGLEMIKMHQDNLVNKYLDQFVIGHEYLVLEKRGEGIMMSNHPSETMSNQDFINRAYGDVLIFGLGLGMIIFPLLQDEDISSITIVENDEGLISLVGEIVKQYDTFNKVNIIHGDAFTYHNKIDKLRAPNPRFDTIYFDIWINIDEKSIGQMEELHDLYRKFRKSGTSLLTSWCYDLKSEIIIE